MPTLLSLDESQLLISPVNEARFPLIVRFYQQFYKKGKPRGLDDVWCVEHIGRSGVKTIIAAVRFRCINQRVKLLTGMLVHPEWRKRQVSTLSEENDCRQAQTLHASVGLWMLSQCKANGVLHALPTYCFALPHLKTYYQSAGFIEIDYALLPAELAALFYRYVKGNIDNPSLVPLQYYV